jgi:Zn-dependent protease
LANFDLVGFAQMYFCLLFALTVHEAAHAFIAYRCGDDTAMLTGRITLNPLSHIDPMGTVVFPFLLYTFGGMLIGWAKPVPFIPRNLNNPKRDPALIAFAGPLANLLTALVVTVLLAVLALTVGFESIPPKLWEVLEILVYISVILFFFNLIPVPPLDGHHILRPILPDKLERMMMGLGPFGILIALIVAGPMIRLFTPVIGLVLALIRAF